MTAQYLTIILIVAVPVILSIVWPLVAGQPQQEKTASAASGVDMEALLARRDTIYSAITDLDFDFETGKLGEDDHAAQREIWVQRGISMLKEIDALPADAASIGVDSDEPTDLDDEIEAAIRARRQSA